MRFDQFLNPFFIYRNRSRILPYLADRRDCFVYRRLLSSFEDRYRGERCFIVGNGPSLAMSDLEKLKGETSFAANKIYLAFDKTTWRPDFYVLEDDQMIRQHYDEISRVSRPVKFIKRDCGGMFRYGS